MNQTLTKEYIQSLAKSLIEATPQEVIELNQVLSVIPNGQEIKEAVASEMMSMLFEQLIGGFASASMYETEEECGCEEECAYEAEEEPSLADVLASQITAQNISKQIREQMTAAEMRPAFVDYILTPDPAVDLASSLKEQIAIKNLANSIKAQAEAAQAIDLASVIKGQVGQQKLTETIQQQMSEGLTEFIAQAVSQQNSSNLEEFLESVLDEIVEEIIQGNVLEDLFSLHSSSIGLYEMVFSSYFNSKVNEQQIPDIVEYKPEYTAYIMTELASYLVVAEGYELTFQVIEGHLIPALKAA